MSSGDNGVANRSWYLGDGIGLVDDKGRVAIPPALRHALIANTSGEDGKSGGTVVIGMHQRNKCLIAYDPDYVDLMVAKLDKREADYVGENGEPDYNIKRRAPGSPLPFDGSGRFVMTPFQRFYSGIGAHAFFYGVLDYIEIWDPKTLIETEDYPDVAKQMARFYMAEKGIAL